MPEVKVVISETDTELNITEIDAVIVLGNSGPQGAAGLNASDISAVLPATWSTADIEIGVDQDSFDRIGTIDYAQFDTTDITGSDAVGKLAWSTEFETLEVALDEGVTLQVGQEQLIRVKNASGSVAIPKFTLVQFAGATGDTVSVQPAVTNGTVPHEYMVGITAEEIAADGFGFVTTEGFITGVNTNAYTLGQILYADPATPGGFTTTKPQAPNLKLPIAAVTRVNSNSGRVLVRMDTGLSLNELHDVQTNGKANHDALVWDSVQSRWENATFDYSWLANIPSSFTPSAHAASHGSAGTDPVTINATQVSGTAVIKTDTALTLNGTAVPIGGTVTLASEFSVAAPITNTGGTIGIDQAALSITASQVSDLASATVGSATNAGTAVYATTSGTAFFATNSGTAVYATTSGTADYSTTSGTAVYATNAGTATYATTAGNGVPTGGTAGQVLAKIDGTNYNTQWVDQSGGSGGGGFTVTASFLLMGA